MTDKSNNHLKDKDVILNKLIRASRKKEPLKEFVRPDPDAIVAYLMGTATQKQEKAITSALLQSESFRREMLEIAQDMDAVAELDLASYEEEAREISVPDLREYLEEHVGRPDVDQRETFWESFQRFWAALTKLRIPQLYAPAAVAATLFTLVVIHLVTLTPWSLVRKDMEPGFLVSNLTRTAESEKYYLEPEQAALGKLRFLLEFKDGQFQLRQVKKRPPPALRSRIVVLLLIDSNDNLIQEFQANVPLTEPSSSEPVVAWAIGLPSRNLYNLKMKSDSVEVKWTQDMGSYGCVTFTYRHEEGHRAVLGFTFDFR
jgi:hypothetical protein